MTRELAVITLFVCATFSSFALAGLETVTGREKGFWDSNSVIIARVISTRPIDVESHPQEAATHIIVLEPLLTLAGKFDPSSRQDIEARLAISRATSSTHQVPKPDSIVLVVISPGDIEGDDSRPCLWVTPDQCLFMPEYSALVPIQGAGDKRILETLSRVREVRSADKSATQPADVEQQK